MPFDAAAAFKKSDAAETLQLLEEVTEQFAQLRAEGLKDFKMKAMIGPETRSVDIVRVANNVFRLRHIPGAYVELFHT